jgi:hypothetical protein
MRRSEHPGELLAHEGAQERLLAGRQLGPDGSAQQTAQDPVGVDGLEKDLLRPVKGGERGASRELGGFLGLKRILAGRRRGREEQNQNRESGEGGGASRPPPGNAQYPVAVSVELGRANTLSVIGTLPMRSSSPSRRAIGEESLMPLT